MMNEGRVHIVKKDNLLKYAVGNKYVTDNANVKLEAVINPISNKALDGSVLKRKIEDLYKRCQDKSDQVLMITINDHGDRCSINFDGNQDITPQNFKKNFLQPLQALKVKVVVNFDACYSGCFVDILKNDPSLKGVCMTSTSRATTIGWGGVGNAYDQTYSDFLLKFKNPLKAHICASINDPYNVAQLAVSGSSPGSGRHSISADPVKAVEEAFGFPNILQQCHRDESQDDVIIKKLHSCPAIKEAARLAYGAVAANVFLSQTNDPNKSPGIKALEQIASQGQQMGAIKESCDIDLSKYAPAATGTLQGSSGKLPGDKGAIR